MDNNNMVVRNNNQPAIRKTTVNKRTLQDAVSQISKSPIYKDVSTCVKVLPKISLEKCKLKNKQEEKECIKMEIIKAELARPDCKGEKRETLLNVAIKEDKKDVPKWVWGVIFTVVGTVSGYAVGYRMCKVNMTRRYINRY